MAEEKMSVLTFCERYSFNEVDKKVAVRQHSQKPLMDEKKWYTILSRDFNIKVPLRINENKNNK